MAWSNDPPIVTASPPRFEPYSGDTLVTAGWNGTVLVVVVVVVVSVSVVWVSVVPAVSTTVASSSSSPPLVWDGVVWLVGSVGTASVPLTGSP